jgi:hypothetical protein
MMMFDVVNSKESMREDGLIAVCMCESASCLILQDISGFMINCEVVMVESRDRARGKIDDRERTSRMRLRCDTENERSSC